MIVLGPTATGKTSFAVQLAEELDGEIVNADSRYLYRGMNIGTAKPSADEMRGIPHHLVDIIDPTDEYSLARFLNDAFAAVELVSARGRLPVVSGGTPQYLRGFLEGWQAPEAPPDAGLRAVLERETAQVLHQRLLDVDPPSAQRIGPHNKRRMIRALEVHAVTGERMSDLQGSSPPPYRTHTIGLRQPRELLYPRIDARVHAMFAAGWLDEVRDLAERGVTAATPAMSAHGYREALAVIEGTLTLGDAIAQTCRMVHRYVRHQETWFRKFAAVQWYDSSTTGFEHAAIAATRAFLQADPLAERDGLPARA